MNQMNQGLRDYRMAIEHYKKVLKQDEQIKNGTIESDGRPLLTDKDIADINEKIKGLTEKRDELLSKDKDYIEIQ